MLGLLRNGPDTGEGEPPASTGSDAAKGGSGTAPHDPAASAGRRPVPGAAVDRIAELAEGSRTAGLPVTVLVEGAPQPLGEPVERAAHRVVQEALTNVHKHAPGATTQIRLAFDPRTVRVQIVNGPPERRPEPTADGEPLLPSGGHGLIGLMERVRLAGGTMGSGPTGDGGFRIDAALPTSAPGTSTNGASTTGSSTNGASTNGV